MATQEAAQIWLVTHHAPAAQWAERCLYCVHWLTDGERDQAVADEYELAERFGLNVATGGMCGHPSLPRPMGASSRAICGRFELRRVAVVGSDLTREAAFGTAFSERSV
jgi:hypothetical protein